MDTGLLSRRYARALLDYADSVGEADALYPSMKGFAHRMLSTPELREAIASPVVGIDDKRRLITEAFGDQLPSSMNRMVDLVLKARRESYFGRIAVSYVDLYRRRRGITVVKLTSASEMADETVERIRRSVAERTHGEVETETIVNPYIEGGFIFQIDDIRLDASLHNQLERIRRGFETGNKVIV